MFINNIIILAIKKNTADASPIATTSTTSNQTTSAFASDYAREDLIMELQESTDSDIPEVPLPTEKVLNSLQLLNNLKDLINKDSCTKEQKIQILTLFPTSWTTIEIMRNFIVSRRQVEKARDLLNSKGILSLPSPKQGKML